MILGLIVNFMDIVKLPINWKRSYKKDVPLTINEFKLLKLVETKFNIVYNPPSCLPERLKNCYGYYQWGTYVIDVVSQSEGLFELFVILHEIVHCLGDELHTNRRNVLQSMDNCYVLEELIANTVACGMLGNSYEARNVYQYFVNQLDTNRFNEEELELVHKLSIECLNYYKTYE